jgi:4-amino-4-deoxy-L-arabinose transferase-like glycosyltransferase
MSPAPTALTRPRAWLALILAGFILLSTIYSVVTPLFEASDELWHYPMVKYLADHNLALPVQDPGNPGPWRQEGSQPPLYYMICAAATFWIDTSDMDIVRRINPHADIGAVRPDGNANMVLHNDAREDFPWSGTVLAMHLVRFLSILMGAGTVYLTYLLALELFPGRVAVVLAAAAFTAFNPMFLFVSAIINNDNLSTLLASLLLLLIVRLIRRRDWLPDTRFYVLLGVASGAGMLAKFQIGFLLPLIALALLIVSIRHHDWRPVVVGGLISGGLTILIAGWWYWRNYDLYGDATGINIFLDIVGRRTPPANLRQLWTERETFMMSFWGLFGGVNVQMPEVYYVLFNVLAAFGILGLLYGLAREAFLRFRTRTCPADRPLYLARFVAALWAIIVLLSLLSWTRITLASQGRLWFSAIAALNIGLAVGLARWSPGSERITRANLGIAAAVFVGLALLAPFTTIRPAYVLDRDATWNEDTLETSTLRAACFTEPDADREALCMAYQPLEGSILPGEYLRFSPAFTVKNPMTHNWSLFVHLNNADGLTEAQRDTYPGGGLVATAEIEPGVSWNNRIAVLLPHELYTPQTLDVYLGLYDHTSNTRMIPAGAGADPDQRRIYLGTIQLETPPGDVPNPVNVNFDNTLRLLGYEVSDRSLEPGTDITVTLYWEAQKRLHTGYVISLQIINPDTFVKAAQYDYPPATPTTDWEPNTTVTDARTLTIAPDAAPGRYRLMVRVYPAGDPDHSLRTLTDAGGQSTDFVWLSWIQVE